MLFTDKITSLIRWIYHQPEVYSLTENLLWLWDRLTGYSFLRLRFQNRTGYRLNLDRPQTFNEKICWKKIHDRNPLIPLTSDKYEVRKYIEEKLGTEDAKNLLLPLLHVTRKPETIPFDSLPDEYVVKATHGSATNLFISKNNQIAPKKIIGQCHRWLRTPYGLSKHEWAYRSVKRRIIIEPFVRDTRGEIRADFKFHMFNGQCELVQIIWLKERRFMVALYTPEWKKVNKACTRYRTHPWTEGKPAKLDKMRGIARRLSLPFDYARVDMFLDDGEIKIGEITHYPGSGWLPYNKDFDLWMGQKLKLKPEYWRG